MATSGYDGDREMFASEVQGTYEPSKHRVSGHVLAKFMGNQMGMHKGHKNLYEQRPAEGTAMTTNLISARDRAAAVHGI